jgi:hypothetical protein
MQRSYSLALTQTPPPHRISGMNKRKRVAWEKHRKAKQKAEEKRKAAKATGSSGGARAAAAAPSA